MNGTGTPADMAGAVAAIGNTGGATGSGKAAAGTGKAAEGTSSGFMSAAVVGSRMALSLRRRG